MDSKNVHTGYIEGQLIIATPLIQDSVFFQSVVYVLVHNEEGAMGIIINRMLDNVSCNEIFDQLHIPHISKENAFPVFFGGPVESARGFVLHTPDYNKGESIKTFEDVSLTANVDILQDMALGQGPKHSILVLGYAGWKPKQLEQELEENGWILVPPSHELLFETPPQQQWKKCAESLGIDINLYSTDVGHA